jgi:hypothetical protein
MGKTMANKERMVSIIPMVRIPPETSERASIKLHGVWMTLGSPRAHFPPTWNFLPSLKELRIINILFTYFRISLAPLS